MEMPEPIFGLKDGAAEPVFLDVHMKRIEKDFAAGAFDPYRKGNTFGGSVHHELLEAIDDFDAKEDAAVFGGFDRFAHALDSAIGEDLFFFAGQEFARPGAVVD